MKTWGQMTDEEKGELLLAHHRGDVIEFTNGITVKEWKTAEPKWADFCCYRIKPKEETYPTKMWVKPHQNGSGLASMLYGPIDGAVEGKSVFTYVDGKPTKLVWEAAQ